MPDWFYRTVARPILFRLNDRSARVLALGTVGTLGKFTLGRRVIEFLGHMAPDPRLTVQVGELRFVSPLGLGWRIDPERRALRALAEFGAGFLVIDENERSVSRAPEFCLAEVDGRLPRKGSLDTRLPIPVLRFPAGSPHTLVWPDGRITPVIPWDLPANSGEPYEHGVVLQCGQTDLSGRQIVDARRPSDLVNQIRKWRSALGHAPIVVADGVLGPEDAAALVGAGATLLLVEAGLIYAGPGLVKRSNEALLARAHSNESRAAENQNPTPEMAVFRHAWIWICLLGSALTLGGIAATLLSFTRVLLPYDENYLHLSADQLHRTLPRLFAFMAHDRGTLSGVMLGLGLFYIVVGHAGARRGVHGAKGIITTSALFGFASFFAFFGFGYFDTLHAFVAAILFQLTIQILVGASGPASESPVPIDVEDSAWRLGQWGQLLWLIHAVGLLIAGLTILSIGISFVLVKEDLAFLCTTRAALAGLGSDLFGVVAHDRATLGGMLLSSGTAMLMLLLWCFRKGRAWVWWAILLLGAPAYGAALGVHFWVGYIDWHHLAPAFAGVGLWLGGLGLSYRYLHTAASRSRAN